MLGTGLIGASIGIALRRLGWSVVGWDPDAAALRTAAAVGALDEMLAHARTELPAECCGLLAGPAEPIAGVVRVTQRYALVNEAASPVRYDASAKSLLSAFKDMREQGLELLAIYHSHPVSPAYPSATDVALAFWPDAIYIICSLAEPERPVVRGFQIRDGAVSEVDLSA